MEAHEAPREKIHVTVTFPLAEGPYQDQVEPSALVGTVRAAAMQGFGVTEDPGLRWFLTHDGQPVDDSHTIGDVAGHAAAVKFRLGKELVQG